jgi:glucose uptake protein GlcU
MRTLLSIVIALIGLWFWFKEHQAVIGLVMIIAGIVIFMIAQGKKTK